MSAGGGPHIITTWVVALALIVAITAAWYITKPVVDTAADQGTNILDGMGVGADVQSRASSTYGLLDVLTTFWGPIGDIVVIIFAVISSARITVGSEYYG